MIVQIPVLRGKKSMMSLFTYSTPSLHHSLYHFLRLSCHHVVKLQPETHHLAIIVP